MGPILAVAAGGACGAVLRYLVASGVQRLLGDGFPWGTLAVNLIGSFVLGFLLLTADRLELPDSARLFGAVGVLGAFTTFSAFSWETTSLMRQGEWLRALVYAGSSVLLGILALVLGGVVAAAMMQGSRG